MEGCQLLALDLLNLGNEHVNKIVVAIVYYVEDLLTDDVVHREDLVLLVGLVVELLHLILHDPLIVLLLEKVAVAFGVLRR